MRSPWILGDARRDGLWLVAPGFLALAAAWSIPRDESSIWFLILFFVTSGILDSGHVYTTLGRTYFNPKERIRDRIYLWAPILIFSAFFMWSLLRLPYLGHFVVYATIFHNVRQFFGISKWYQRQNEVFRPWSDRFLYALCGWPFLVAHFRTDDLWVSYYTISDVFRWPSSNLESVGFAVYALILVSWVGYESFIFRHSREWNRLSAIGLPAVLYGICFLLGRSQSEILIPLIASHGAAYIALTASAMVKTRQDRVFSPKSALLWCCMIALVFGLSETLLEEHLLGAINGWVLALVMGIYLTPLFCHYVFDAIIWRGSHPEAKDVYGL